MQPPPPVLRSLISSSSLALMLACVPPSSTQGGPGAQPPPQSGEHVGTSGSACEAACTKMVECGLDPSVESCAASGWCESTGDALLATVAQSSCDEIYARGQAAGAGAGGDGSQCRASRASAPVQDCPAGYECCNSTCHRKGTCGWPTGR